MHCTCYAASVRNQWTWLYSQRLTTMSLLLLVVCAHLGLFVSGQSSFALEDTVTPEVTYGLDYTTQPVITSDFDETTASTESLPEVTDSVNDVISDDSVTDMTVDVSENSEILTTSSSVNTNVTQDDSVTDMTYNVTEDDANDYDSMSTVVTDAVSQGNSSWSDGNSTDYGSFDNTTYTNYDNYTDYDTIGNSSDVNYDNYTDYDTISNSSYDDYNDTLVVPSDDTEDVVRKKAFHKRVPIEAVGFMGAVGAFLVLLVVFFLYLNKSLCFSECGGFPCIDKIPAKKDKNFKLGHGPLSLMGSDKAELLEGSAYQYCDDDSSSSDSDDEVLKHYQNSLAHGPRGSIRSSVRSGKSARSKKSEKSAKSKLSPLGDKDAASLAEKGQAEGETSQGSEGEVDKQDGCQPRAADMSPDAQPSVKSESNPELDDQHTYENKAFLTEQSASMFGSDQALTPTDRTMSNDEHLFDVSDLQGEPPLISKCGSLEVSFRYEAKRGRMHVTIHQAREIPAKDRGGASNVQVRMMLLPTKKQKFKTKVKIGENPTFDESFIYNKIFPDDVHGMGIRVRLYGLERMRRERMIGESIVGFASLNLDEETTHWMVLEPRSNLSGKGHGDSGFDVSSLSRSDSASSTQSLQHGGMPELLIGLAYNGTTGRLSVEVIKGSNFRNMAMNRAPDTYVKLTLMSTTGQELQRCKTSVRRGQPNPLFKETFMFQVAQFQLPEVTVMVSVYNKKSMKKKEMIGWFSLGMNSSGEEEGSHWSDMRESKGEQVCRWHVLLES